MTLRLELNPIACTGHQLCADLLPELIEIDEWGFPMLAGNVPFHLEGHARRAVGACPTLALRLTRVRAQNEARRAG